MAVHEIHHPIVRDKLGRLRQQELASKDFRALVSGIGMCLAYEASRNLRLEKKRVASWSGLVEVEQVREEQITIVPILRAGLGMVDGVLKVVPGARISVVGLYRDEKTLQPVPYYAKLVHDIDRCTAMILDPMLATGGTLVASIDLLKKAGCQDISGLFLVAAPEGIARVRQMHPEVDLYVAAIDERLNRQGYILPGIGDAGDRFFGAP
ncbi:uracil phosphoribosyltransferase [Desulfobulbus alkaliphilus]|uniref:uracil phosphoribosyltransferase n=1 Tax=Desulfobulbus alkaliphilus TaxID=869814 RepID=UPI00196439F7|nr:uracil phosphoribosyltransferase [Desulfobulbus alkaliphilus]MBM9536862.1 uracil phosphoribosyltransferase [Desulfobulbus alkaliphilus]